MRIVIFWYALLVVSVQMDNGQSVPDERRESLNKKHASPLEEISRKKKALLDHRMTMEEGKGTVSNHRDTTNRELGARTNGDVRDQSAGAAETPLDRTKKDSGDQAWEAYKLKYNKIYPNATEEAKRKAIFLDSKETIDQHNQLCDQGKVTFTMVINQFADMTNQEFNQQMNGDLSDACDLATAPVQRTVDLDRRQSSTPAAVNWTQKGCVTKVEYQGQCGSCYTFSAAGAVESIHCITTGKLVELSEQQLLDCSWPEGNTGCDGGFKSNAFKYIIDNKGIATEAAYPYEAVDGPCERQAVKSGVTISNYTRVANGSEDALRVAVARQPVSVGVDASQDSFRFYGEGVYYESDCNQNYINHAMLVVGYGTDDGGDYWIVKNSYSHYWGEEGYIRMARNMDNNCGIATLAMYPVV